MNDRQDMWSYRGRARLGQYLGSALLVAALLVGLTPVQALARPALDRAVSDVAAPAGIKTHCKASAISMYLPVLSEPHPAGGGGLLLHGQAVVPDPVKNADCAIKTCIIVGTSLTGAPIMCALRQVTPDLALYLGSAWPMSCPFGNGWFRSYARWEHLSSFVVGPATKIC